MSNLSKLALVLLLVFTGCAKEKPVVDNNDFLIVDDPMPKPQGNSVSYPANYDIVFVNPITISYPEIEGEEVIRGQFVEIDGLVDEAIESAINEELRSAAESMFRFRDRSQAPSYRGIDVRIPKDIGQAKQVNIDSYVHYNYNNILSVVIYGSSCFDRMTSHYCFSVSEGLNFDLISGKRLSLSDIFTDQTDVSKLLVTIINKQLYWSNDFESTDPNLYQSDLITPFTQLGGSQGFFLDEYTIGLLFGPDTSELDTHLNASSVNISYDELRPNIALAQRFVSNKQVFVNEIVEKHFVDQQMENKIVESKTLKESHPKIVASSSYFEGLDPSKIDLIEPEINKIHGFIQEALLKLPVVERANVFVGFSKIGSYTIMTTQMAAYQLVDAIHDGPDGEWSINDIGPNVSSIKHIIYDEEGRTLTLKDMFVEGYDYESLVSARLIAALERNGLPKGTYLQEWTENLNFRLYSDSFYFTSFAEIEGEYKGIGFPIPYRDIKSSNLTIFN